MPEQQSSRAQPITTAPFTQPFQTEIYPLGVGGVDLRNQHDAIAVGDFAQLTNLVHTQDHGVTVRPGLTAYATGGVQHHSVRRLTDPQSGGFTRVWGIDQRVYFGAYGALTDTDGPYSGDPLYLLPHRPPLSGDPWMFVADRSRMRKIRFDGVSTPIGLPAPTAAPTTILGTRNLTAIATFATGSDTDPVLWTPNRGYTYDDPPAQTDLPEILGPVNGINAPDADNTAAIHFGRLASTKRPTGDYVFFGRAITRDLTLVGGQPASDDDYIHLWLNFSHPQYIEEFRLYLVCAASFSPTVLPGIPDGLGNNTDFYVKAFSQNDFFGFLQAQLSSVSAAEAARVHAVRDAGLQDQGAQRRWIVRDGRRILVVPPDPNDPFADPAGTEYVRGPRGLIKVQRTNSGGQAVQRTQAQQDPTNATTVPGPAGADQWHEIGMLGVPLRRGDFVREGETAGRDWSTITGIVCFIKTAPSPAGPVAVRLGHLYLHGGAALDTGDPGAQPYDYRTTVYDPRTGAESNPSPEQATTAYLDTLRRTIVVTPQSAGDLALRQRVYRRGGTNIADWQYLGTNTADGASYTDTTSDDTVSTAPTVNLDHFQPVPTVNDAGVAVYAQPCPVLFGPANGLIFALGDPYRPGHLYWCHPDEPDHWGAANNYEVCAPSEELMAGFLHGTQPYCFSRERLYAIYPSLSHTVPVTVSATACARGIVGRHAWAIGVGGIYGVARDSIFVTSGGGEQIVSREIERLFRGETWNGYLPIDFTVPRALRLSLFDDCLYFLYQDTGGVRRVLRLPLLFERKAWMPLAFAQDLAYLEPDVDTPERLLLCGGKSTGKSYTHTGFSDDGTAITWRLRTGNWNLGRPREDKLLGDQILDLDQAGVTGITLQNRLNDNTVVNIAQAIDPGTGRQRYIFDSFGTVPQRARTISTEITGSSASARPTLYVLGQSYIPEPDVTLNRVTQWDDLGHPDESYITGITLDCDTGGVTRTILFERDFAGLITTIATKTVNCNGRHKIKFSWNALPAHQVRIRPTDDCLAWILYRADWISVPEPPRIAGWDIHFEADGDQYYTGLDLYCDTGGAEKQIEVTVDGVVLTNPYTGEAFWRVTANGRLWKHLTFQAGRGHVFHFRALDANPGLLYRHKWYTEVEPSEQSNWNQNFSPWGTQADKFLKAIVFEADTFGQNKTVRVEVDGTLADTLTVNCNGRLVQQLTLSTQKLGRIWRIYPADGNPGRLYTAVPLFDVEPYKLNRWETQETTHDLPGFHSLIDAHITLKSTAEVLLTVSTHVNQTGTILTDVYTIPSTGSVKLKRYLPFVARKGVLYKYLFTSAADFFLYQEESVVQVQPWGSAQAVLRQPFGNDDVDRTRNMLVPALAAARPGGGT